MTRTSVVCLAFLIFGSVAVSASAARHYRRLPMLRRRTCSGLLNRGNFVNAGAQQLTVPGDVGAGYASTCIWQAQEEGVPPHRGVGGGAVTLDVDKRSEYEFRGRERNLASMTPSPQGYFRSRRRAGEHAYGGFLLNTSGGADAVWGVVQVRNDVATVAGEFPSSDGEMHDLTWLDDRLRAIAFELCPRCK